MKKHLIAALVATFSIGAFAMSLAEASAQIATIVDDPSAMSSVMSQLSADDQVAFLKRVNNAIEGTKLSPDSKTKLFLAVNKAALVSRKGNLKALLAEVYATVPPASLTVLNERFAADLFNRKANPARPISDDVLKKNALVAMEAIQARTAGGNDKDVRDVFAILMFIRVADGSPADIKDVLLAGIADESIRKRAGELWIPEAMGEGPGKPYNSMLAAADVSIEDTPRPATNFVNLQGASVLMVSLMSDISPTVDGNGAATVSFTEGFLDPNKYALPSEGTAGLNRVPRSLNPDDPWYPGKHRDDKGESGGYRMQTTF